MNTVQRRFTGFIRFIGGFSLSTKDATAALRASNNLVLAAKERNVDSVRAHLASNADINHVNEGMTAILHAAQNGDLETIKVLIAAGCAVNKNNTEGKDALMLAAENGHVDVVNYLINWGADVTRTDGKGLTALTLAACLGKTVVLQSFIDAGVAIDEPMLNGSTPLMFAAEAGQVEFVEALIVKGADINKTNINDKATVLMYAANAGRTDVVKLLLANKASVKEKDKNDRTALMKAAWQGHTEVVKFLLANKASINEKDKCGETALIKAAWQGHTEVVKLLLANKASINEKDIYGATALIKAAGRGHHATLTSLIESCVDQYNALLSVLRYQDPHITKVIVRAWLHSAKNKLDAVTAICCVFASGPCLWRNTEFGKYKALKALANGGLTLTKDEFDRLTLSTDLEDSARDYVKGIFVDRDDIPPKSRVGNAYWSGNHALVDELIDAPFKTVFNPLGLLRGVHVEDFNPNHPTGDNGDYLHAIGRFHDQSRKLDWGCDMDPMTELGWRSMVTVVLRSARKEATEASQQISSLLADPERGLALIDQTGQPVPADNIRLKDALFAFELSRNERLNQIAEPPEPLPASESLSWKQENQQEARKAQAKAILASNRTYSRLKLDMPALAQAKDYEKK